VRIILHVHGDRRRKGRGGEIGDGGMGRSVRREWGFRYGDVA
jgi:hypothetical protein